MPNAPKSIPENPHLYSQSLLNAARAYKHDLTVAQEEGVDLGKGHRVSMKHITSIPTPWFINTKDNRPGATWFEHIAHTASRIHDVMTSDADLKVPFDQKGGRPGQPKPKGTLVDVFPADANRVVSIIASELTRMGLGLQVRSLSRGKATDQESVLREVRQSVFYASQNYTVNETKRPLVVNMPFHPLWNKTKVQAMPGEPTPISLLEATKTEQKLVQHLIGPNPNGNDQVSDIMETRIAQMCLKAMPDLFTRHDFQFIQYHQKERAALKAYLERIDIFTQDSRSEALEQILEMLSLHVQCSPEWFGKLEKAELADRQAAGSATAADKPFDIIGDDTKTVIGAFLDPLIVRHKAGDKSTVKQMNDRLLVPVTRLAMLLDTSNRASARDSAEVREEMLVLIDRLKYMCNAVGGNGYEVAPTMAKMLLHAYGDEKPDSLKAYL